MGQHSVHNSDKDDNNNKIEAAFIESLQIPDTILIAVYGLFNFHNNLWNKFIIPSFYRGTKAS